MTSSWVNNLVQLILSLDPDNMVAMLYTWQAGDCSAQEPYNGEKSLYIQE